MAIVPDISERVRVLHFIAGSDHRDYFQLIARHTDAARFDLTVGSLGRPGPMHAALNAMGVRTFAVKADGRRQYPWAAAKLARRLKQERTDILHLHLFESSIVGVAAGTLARTPVVVFTGHHSHEVPLHDRRLLFEVDRAACRLSDVVIAPSQQMARTFTDKYGCPPEKVEVIHHGLDLDRFSPTDRDGMELRTTLGFEDAVLILAIGKHHWIKNHEGLVRAFARIAPEHPEARLVIAGIGDSTATNGLVAELGLDDVVRVIPPHADPGAVFAAADLFVHAAMAESFAFVIIEAMAMAKPVVSTPVGIAPEVIQDGVNGFAASGSDVNSLTEALERALERRDSWASLGAAARQCALSFTAQRWVRDHEDCYLRRLRLRRSTPAHPLDIS